jgi:Ser/Thr protein kinase RdoA (MazF antagonist)
VPLVVLFVLLGGEQIHRAEAIERYSQLGELALELHQVLRSFAHNRRQLLAAVPFEVLGEMARLLLARRFFDPQLLDS